MNKRTLEDCARCGSCKARCPVYELTLNESLSPRGRLMLLKGLGEGAIKPGRRVVERLMNCSLCGLCDISCPVGLKPTEFIYRGRASLRSSDRKRLLVRTAMRAGLRYPALGMKAARLFGGVQILSPFKLKIPPHPLRDELQVIKPERPVGRVGVFAGCSTNYLMPQTGESLINMLVSMGYEVVLPRGEACCGVPLRGLGLHEEAVRFAEKNYELFGKLNAEAVLSPCPSCVLALREHYKVLIGKSINAVNAVRFLSEKLASREVKKRTGLVWHEPCHERYGLGESPDRFLEMFGIERREPGCCGFGLDLADKGLAREFLAKRAVAYKGAEAVVTSCPACLVQLESGGMKAMHLIELIEEALFLESAE